jgi:exopolyphosphatase/guanosine-5'-triphosphate,3'-diphosphate pyrophosphatase
MAERGTPREVAVVDIGSNSVRLVVYRLYGRAIVPVLNEKTMAGLGRDLMRTGRLSEKGIADSLAALARFRLVLAARGVQDVRAVATAAVREALDGPQFAARGAEVLGHPVRIISGPEEGWFSAQGVMTGIPDADGVVADLGGASLELIETAEGRTGEGESHLLGPLSLAEGGFVRERVRQKIEEVLATSRVLGRVRGRSLYAVGGAWRAFGLFQMQGVGHPLHVLHQYALDPPAVAAAYEGVLKSARRGVEPNAEIQSRRLETLPYAACLLDALCRIGKPARVVVSAYGVREGVLSERFTEHDRATDPLVAATLALQPAPQRAAALGQALQDWLGPLVAHGPTAFSAGRDATLFAAACRLADLGASLHPDHRADLVYDLVLRAPAAGVTHSERAFLASVALHRYRRTPPLRDASYQALLDDRRRAVARVWGALIRLGAELCGRAPVFLTRSTLVIEEGVLVLRHPPADAALYTDMVRKRLEQAREALGLAASAFRPAVLASDPA